MISFWNKGCHASQCVTWGTTVPLQRIRPQPLFISVLWTLDMFRTSRTSNPITNSSRELIMPSTAGKLPLPSPGCDPTIHEARAGSESDREAFCKEVDAKLLKWQHSRDNIEEETTRFTIFDLEDLRWVIHTS